MLANVPPEVGPRNVLGVQVFLARTEPSLSTLSWSKAGQLNPRGSRIANKFSSRPTLVELCGSAQLQPDIGLIWPRVHQLRTNSAVFVDVDLIRPKFDQVGANSADAA